MSFEIRIDFPISAPVSFMRPSFEILLKRVMPISTALWSRATKIPSTITTAPSIMIPKSIAPIDRRFADIPFNLRQMKAKSSARGIIRETTIVVRQSAMKIRTIIVTKIIPSIRLCKTV